MAVDRLLVFAKAPVAGGVKTRLTPPLPPDEAASLYEACLRDVVARCARERARVELWYHADRYAAEYFPREFPHITLHTQSEGHLGEKMSAAFDRSFADGAQHVLIVGSDVPTLPDAVLSAAFDQIRDADMVIGPTLDGGYYLIGLARTAWPRAQQVFCDIEWSTARVFRSTIDRSVQAALELRMLPGWYDLDTVDDLRQALTDAEPDSKLARWAARPEAIHFVNAG
jgi:rSAM/selenodomain-associated transferase 1